MKFKTTFLSIAILLSLSQQLFAKDCQPTFEALQKKMLTQNIARYPLTYGKDLEVISIDTLDCNEQGTSRYLIHYNDILCFDINKPEHELLKCAKVRCQSPARINFNGVIDFETASVKSCIKIK